MNLTETQIASLKTIDAGEKSGQYVYASPKSMKAFTDAGMVEGNPTAPNERKEIPYRLTAKGKESITVTTENTTSIAPATGQAPAAAAPAATALFTIASVEPPAIVRKGSTTGGRAPKYPQLDQLEIGQAIFIPAAPDADIKKLSKGFGSIIADKNNKNKEKYFTTRALEDGQVAGFGDSFKGVKGTGIYRRPVDEKPVRKPRTKKADTAAADGAAAGTAPAGAAA